MRIRAYFTGGEWSSGELKAVRRSEEEPDHVEVAVSFVVPFAVGDSTALVVPGFDPPRSVENIGIELNERDCFLLLQWLQNRAHLHTLAESDVTTRRLPDGRR